MQLILTVFMVAALLMLSAFLMWYLQLLVRGTTSYEQYRRRRAAKLGIETDTGYGGLVYRVLVCRDTPLSHDCMQAAAGASSGRVQHHVSDLLPRVSQISSTGT